MRLALRPVLPLALAATLLVGLAACAPASNQSDGDSAAGDSCPAAPSGAGSESVKTTGDEGAAPTVTFDTPLNVKATERSVITKGDGDPLADGEKVVIHYVLLNGTSGDVLETFGYDGTAVEGLPLSESSVFPGLYKTLVCTPIGSRVAGVITPADAFGDEGQSDLGIGKDDDIVFVADVVSVETLPKPAEWTTDVPTVDLAASPPVVTLPATAPPTELQLTVLKEGDGKVVPASASVTVDYQGTSWNTGTIFDQSYGKTPATFSLSGVVTGFAAAIAGQKVGSTVLVTIPPELAYGTDPAAADLGGQTLVFLIDIQKAE